MRFVILFLGFASFMVCSEYKKIPDEEFQKIVEEKISETEITYEKLAAAGKDQAFWLIYDYMMWREPKPIARNSLSIFPRHMQLVYAAYNADVDLMNGGLEQYFFNSYGEHAEVAADGFEAIGAHKTASILRRANSLRKATEIMNMPDKERTLENFSALYKEDEMSKLNAELIEVYEDVETLRNEFIWNNLEQFVPRNDD